jgi:hypothetical protein
MPRALAGSQLVLDGLVMRRILPRVGRTVASGDMRVATSPIATPLRMRLPSATTVAVAAACTATPPSTAYVGPPSNAPSPPGGTEGVVLATPMLATITITRSSVPPTALPKCSEAASNSLSVLAASDSR